MPVFISPIQNRYRAIDKPIVDQVIKQLINDGFLVKPRRYVHTDNVFSAKKHSTSEIYYPGELSLTVEPTYTHTDQADWALKKRWMYYNPVFADKSLGVYLHPMPVEQEVNITLTYTDDNIEVLRTLREGLFMHRNLGWYGSSHTVQYTLIPSKETMEVLELIHERREAKFGYAQTFNEWFILHSDDSFHGVEAGRHQEGTYGVRQIDIEGNIDTDIGDIEEFTVGVYSFSMGYKFRYARVAALVATYPIQIHQQLMPRQYTVTANTEHTQYGFTDLPVVRGLGHAVDPLARHIRIPWVDRLKLDKFPTGYAPLWTALLSVDDLPIDTNVLCRLDEIEDIAMHPSIITYLKAIGHASLTLTHKCPFMLVLHRDNYLMDDRYLTVDSNLDVRLTSPINQRYNYRISFCILINLEALSIDTLESLKEYNIAEIIADTVNLVSRRMDSPKPINYPIIPRDLTSLAYLRAVSPLIDNKTGEAVDQWRTDVRDLTRIPKGVVGFRTVQTQWVTSHRK